MKARNLILTLALCFVGAGVCFADNANIGTWKLNEAKSKIPPGTPGIPKTVVCETVGDSVKVTTDGSDKDGKPTHTEWTGKFDGKYYPITGDPSQGSRSYKQVDDHTLTMAIKRGGKVITTGHIAVSADGKIRTVKLTTTDSDGKKVSSTSVYDRQ
jgi:hypothetical protein